MVIKNNVILKIPTKIAKKYKIWLNKIHLCGPHDLSVNLCESSYLYYTEYHREIKEIHRV